MRCAALVFAVSLAAAAQTPVDQGFDRFYNLEFDEAIAAFTLLANANPANPDLHNHVAQSILFREMFRAGALESELVTGGNSFLRREKMNPSPEDQRRFFAEIDESMRLCADALGRNARDADALYARGVAYGLRANYNFLVRKAWYDALRDATEARRSHQEVLEIDPTRVDAMMIPAAHKYIVANLPWTQRVFGFLFGFRGDKEGGIEILRRVAREGEHDAYDAQILLAAIYRRERRFQDAVDLLNKLIPRFPRNYLLRLELALMYGDLLKKNEALAVLDEVDRLKREGAPGYDMLQTEKILYFRATVQFWYRDFDAALANLRRVTARAEDLDPNTGVTAWMRLGQTYDLLERRPEARKSYEAAIAYAPDSSVADECRRYIKKPYTRS